MGVRSSSPPLLLLPALLLALHVACGQKFPPEDTGLTERIPTEWLNPPFGPTEAVPVDWLRPLPPDILRSAQPPSLVERSGGLMRHAPWVTPLELLDAPAETVTNGQNVADSGRFNLGSDIEVTFTSPGYPDQYPSYIWNTWIFESTSTDGLLNLTCPEWELGVGDYFIVTASGISYRATFTSTSQAPEVTGRATLRVEIRSDQVDAGRFSCVVRTGDAPSSSEAGSAATGAGSGSSGGGSGGGGSGGSGSGSESGASGTTQPTSPPVTSPATEATTTRRPTLNEPDCGVTKYDTRIVGGSPAPPNAYPWLVGLASPGRTKPFCGGSIINERYILTAAHCIQRRRANRLTILVRKHQRDRDPNQISFAVSKIIPHPGYNPSTQDKDLALVRLKVSLRYLLDNPDYRVRSICLPTAACANCHAGKTAILAGWGVLKSGTASVPNTVQHVKVPIVSNEQCARDYNKIKIGISSNMVCAGLAAGGKDTCQGDSGGPMMVRSKNNVYTQQGVVSFGKGCASAGFPGVYTRLSQFYGWIEKNSRS